MQRGLTSGAASDWRAPAAGIAAPLARTRPLRPRSSLSPSSQVNSFSGLGLRCTDDETRFNVQGYDAERFPRKANEIIPVGDRKEIALLSSTMLRKDVLVKKVTFG